MQCSPLNEKDRYIIEILLLQGATQIMIAMAVGCAQSTISRELKYFSVTHIRVGKKAPSKYMNGLIRKIFPKDTNFSEVMPEQVK